MVEVTKAYVIEGYGASYRRDLDCWIVYSMPWVGDGYPEVCRVIGCASKPVDDLLATLRSTISHQPQPSAEQAVAKIVAWLEGTDFGDRELDSASIAFAIAIQRGDWK